MLGAQIEGEVVVNLQRRIEGIVLEGEADVAILGEQVVDAHVADVDVAVGDLLEARDHAQGGGLAAARGAEDAQELAVAALKGEVVYGEIVLDLLLERGAGGIVIPLVNVVELQDCHYALPPFPLLPWW